MGFGAVQVLAGATKLSELGIDVTKDFLTYLIRNIGTPTLDQDAATKKYVDDNIVGITKLSELTIDTSKDWLGYLIRNLADPTLAQDAATKKYVDDRIVAYSNVVWLLEAPTVLTDQNRTVGTGWIDLDLTASTSSSAKIVILNLRIFFDSVGAGGLADIQVRSKDRISGWFPFMRGGVHNGDIAGAHIRQVVLCGMDGAQTIQYKLGISGTCQADFFFDVLGYIE